MNKIALGLAVLLAGTGAWAAPAEDEAAVEVEATSDTVEEMSPATEPADDPTLAPAPAASAAAPAAPSVAPAATRVTVRPVGEASSGRAKLYFRNDVSDRYDLVEVRFVMNGRELSRLANPERAKSYAVYEGTIDPGRHIVTAHLTYQGKSRGPFTYTKGYRFKVSSDQVLTTPAGRNVSFTIVGKEDRGLTTPNAGRLAVTVEENAARAR